MNSSVVLLKFVRCLVLGSTITPGLVITSAAKAFDVLMFLCEVSYLANQNPTFPDASGDFTTCSKSASVEATRLATEVSTLQVGLIFGRVLTQIQKQKFHENQDVQHIMSGVSPQNWFHLFQPVAFPFFSATCGIEDSNSDTNGKPVDQCCLLSCG